MILAGLMLLIFLAACSPQNNPEITPDSSTKVEETVISPTAPLPTDEPALTILPTATVIPSPTPTPDPGPPGIILFIGDGMGAAHRQAATWLALGPDGTLVMDSLLIHGWAQTASANYSVTDSAAAATAMATGQLTNNQVLGMDPTGQSLESILELAQANGWAVGLVTTVQLTHATPAAFAVHINTRNDEREIARMMMAQQIDVLLGGGEDGFFGRDEAGCFPGNGRQPSGEGLVGPAIAEGYTYVCTREDLLKADLPPGGKLLGLFGAEQMIVPYSPNLEEMTSAALAVLSQDPDGFFLMVEAGQIDWAAHDNLAKDTMQLTIGLDTAVTAAKIFTLARPNTLLIVTSDHETGGMSVNQDGAGSFRQDGPYHTPQGTAFWVDWSTGSHTGANVPVTAEGPYSGLLAGEYTITRIYEAMRIMVVGQ